MSDERPAAGPSLTKNILLGFGLGGLGLAAVSFVLLPSESPRLVLAAVPIAASLFAGRLVAGHVSKLLGSAAKRVLEMDPEDEEGADLGVYPAEICAAAEVLRSKLDDVQGMAKTARLMSSGLGHELRSPLQNLMSEVDLALLKEREPAEYRRILLSQKEELHKLGRMVDNLLALCAAHESRRHGAVEVFDIGKEADIRLERERALAKKQQVQLQVEQLGELDYEGDREATMLVLRNLVTNAIDWSPEGGVVNVLLTGEEGEIEIIVDDSGPGLAATDRERIFDPKHRGRQGASVSYGLSLALTKQAVEMHDGTIEADASPLGGLRFRVHLPRRG